MVTKKIKIKDKDGVVTEVDIGAEAKNISEDADHRFTSDTEKEKLNGIDKGANKYTHPTTSGNKHIPSGGSTGKILGWKADGEAQWVDDKNTTYSAFKGATSAAAGGTGLVPAPAAGDQAKFLSGDGTWDSVNDMAPTFTQAETRANIASGEKVSTLFGKIAKWFTDLKTGTFATVVNNLTTTVANTVLDGRQGKALNDKITEINSTLGGWKLVETATTGDSGSTSLAMQEKLEAENMYIIFIRHLGADTVYPPYALLLYMRSSGYNYTALGEMISFKSTDMVGGKLTINFNAKQWARMWIYKIS